MSARLLGVEGTLFAIETFARTLSMRPKAQTEFLIEYKGKQVKQFRQSFRSACKRAEIMYHVVPSSIRHLFATTLLQEGGDLSAVSRLMGPSSDQLQHVIYGALDPTSPHYDPQRVDYWTDILRQGYVQVDNAVGRILEDVDLEQTVVGLVSDHGFSALASSPYMKKFLKEAGLLAYMIDPVTGEMTIDWNKSKCFPLEPCQGSWTHRKL